MNKRSGHFTYTENEFYNEFGYTYTELERFEIFVNDSGWTISNDLYDALNDAMWGETEQIVFILQRSSDGFYLPLFITKDQIKTEWVEYRYLHQVIDALILEAE